MPAEYLRCVNRLVGKGKSRKAAQKSCAIAYWKKHKRTPQQDEQGEDTVAKARKRLQARLRAAEERGDEEEAANLRALLEQETPSSNTALTVAELGQAAEALSSDQEKRGIRSAYRRLGVNAEDMPPNVREALVLAGIVVEFRDEDGSALFGVPVDEPDGGGKEESIWGEVPGSYEKIIDLVRQAVRDNESLFGLTDDHDWVHVEATTGTQVIVRREPGPEYYRADWAMVRDPNGETESVALSNIRSVTVTVSVAVSEAAEHELVESTVAPVRVLQEEDKGEGEKRVHLMTVECSLGVADTPTTNGRVYPKELFEALVAESAEGTQRSKSWLGEAGHPETGRPRLTHTISTPWRNLRLEENTLVGETDIVDTRLGGDLQKLIRAGTPVQVSSRCFARTKKEVQGGREVEVVEKESAMAHWGGWDFLLGAAASAGLRSWKEDEGKQDGSATRQADIETDTSGETLIEELLAMNERELRKLIAEAAGAGAKPDVDELAASISASLRPLLENKGTDTPNTPEGGGGEPAGDGDTKPEGDDKGTPDISATLARMESVMGEVAGILKEQKGDKTEAAEQAVLEGARKATLEHEAIAAWPPEARKLLEKQLAQAKAVEEIPPIVTRTKQMLEDVRILVGPGIAAGTAGVHVALNAPESQAERAKLWRDGLLTPEHLPTTVQELLDLACEGIEDNGAGGTVRRFDDSVSRYLDEQGAPFPSFSPGNPAHVARMQLINTAKLYPQYLRPHLREFATMPLYQMLMEWTGTSALATSVPFVLPLIRQMFPRLIATELCSVQPMNRSTGNATFLDIQYDPSGSDPSNLGQFDSDYGVQTSEQVTLAAMMLQIVTQALTMQNHKLQAEWSTEAWQDMRADWGLDIATVMLSALADEIAREINGHLIERMLNATDRNAVATAGNITWRTGLPAAGYQDLSEWAKELYTAILRANALVINAYYRPTNWILSGVNAHIRLTKLENWKVWSGDRDGMDWDVGIRRVGSIEGDPGWRVYVSQYMPSGRMLLGRKGSEWPDAGYIYAPYIPLYTTPIQTDPNTLCNREAVQSRYGEVKAVGNMFATVTVASGTGVPW